MTVVSDRNASEGKADFGRRTAMANDERRRLRATATARGWLTTCFLPFFIFVSCGFPKSANLVYGIGFRGFDIY